MPTERLVAPPPPTPPDAEPPRRGDTFLSTELDLREAALLTDLTLNTVRSYVTAGRIPSRAVDRPLRRPNQAESGSKGVSLSKQHYITYGALLEYARSRGARNNPIPAKPLPQQFFDTYGELADDLRDRPALPVDTLRDEARDTIAMLRDDPERARRGIEVATDDRDRRPHALRRRLREAADEAGVRVRLSDMGVRERLSKLGRAVQEPTAILVQVVSR